MKSSALTFIKFILPLGLGLAFWQGHKLMESIGPIGPPQKVNSLTSSTDRNREDESFDITWKKGTDTAAALFEPNKYESETSTSPKDRVPSMVTLGWGVTLTETR